MDHDERIRDRAYALWVEAGSPDGRDLEFWHQAEREEADGEKDMSSDEQIASDLPLAQPSTVSR